MSENSGSINDNFNRLFSDAKEYVKLKTDYFKVLSVEKFTILISALIIFIVALMLLMSALFYLFFALAYFIAPMVGGLTVSFGLITLFYVLMLVILFVFRVKLIFNPVLNLLFKLFYDEDEKDEETTLEKEKNTNG